MDISVRLKDTACVFAYIGGDFLIAVTHGTSSTFGASACSSACSSCSSLLQALATVGIVALIDEATGYQKDRPDDALQRLWDLYTTLTDRYEPSPMTTVVIFDGISRKYASKTLDLFRFSISDLHDPLDIFAEPYKHTEFLTALRSF
jgi:hypothetical protein